MKAAQLINAATEWYKKPSNKLKLLPVPILIIWFGKWRMAAHVKAGCTDGFLPCSSTIDIVYITATLLFLVFMAIIINVSDWT